MKKTKTVDLGHIILLPMAPHNGTYFKYKENQNQYAEVFKTRLIL